MKTKFYFGALAALALGLTGCSSEEPAPGQGGTTTGGERYMAVTIKSLSDTKAAPGDNEFEVGTDKENEITAENIRFYFFTAEGAPFLMQQMNVNGTVTNTNMVKPTEITKHLTNGATVKMEGVLVLGTPAGEGYQGETPSKVIVLANPKQASFESFSNISIAEFQGKSSTLDNLSFDTFSMTSSSYIDKDGHIVCYTDVTDHIMTTEDAAKGNPAQIFLERLAAKVRVTGLRDYTVKKKNEDGSLSDGKFFIRSDGGQAKETTLKVSLLGWRLINMATSTYALKNIAGMTMDGDNAPYPDWNDYTRHRCYWANTRADKNTLTQTSFDLDAADQFTLGNFDSSNPSANIAYTYGNTKYQPTLGASDRSELCTGIVVKAQITDADDNPVDLVRWGAEYFTLDYFKEVVVNAWNTTDGTMTATVDDVKLVVDPDNKNTFKVQVLNNDFAGRFTGVYWWKNGVTTYRANIIHYQGDDKTLFGVVRNHIYDYTFTNVVGLGLPGEDPVNPPTLEESYLAAVVNVLNWHVISNQTVLE